MSIVLETRDLSKRYGSLLVNNNINFQLKAGETHVILGENGAGKSTLVNMLYGLISPTSGAIYLQGKEVVLSGAHVAIEHGVGLVSQHFHLIENFTVLENVVLGEEHCSKLGILQMQRSYAGVRALAHQHGFRLNLHEYVSELSVELRQQVEVLKILYRRATILIFDEPTAVLSPPEVKVFGESLRKLNQEGKSVILITHKLTEVLEMGDRCTILRKGKLIETLPITPQLDPLTLTNSMVDHEVNLDFSVYRTEYARDRVLLDVKNLNLWDRAGNHRVKDLSFSLYEGEILGIVGIDGSGQTEAVEAIAGLASRFQGQLTFEGQDLSHLSPKEILSQGITHIPEDRHKGLLLEYSMADNFLLQQIDSAEYQNRGFVNFLARNALAERLIQDFHISPPDGSVLAKHLSGGNQQKVIIARETFNIPRLLLAVHPTRGLDVGMVELIYRHLLRLKQDHKMTTLLVSSELEELLAVSDRLMVLHHGRNHGILEARETDLSQLGALMGGNTHVD